MKKFYRFPKGIIALKYLLPIILALHVSLASRLFAQCSDFYIIVDTDPPYLTYCPGDTVLAFPIISGGTAPFTYSWTTGGTDSIEVLVALENGWYTTCLTVTDANGCVAYGCKHIKPTYYNLYIFENGPQCLGESVLLQVSVDPPHTFLWSTGETSNPIYVTEPGIYSVTVTDPINGCVKELEVEAEFIDPPIPTISGPDQICDGLTTTLEVDNPEAYWFFTWSPSGETTSSIVISESGTYEVTVTDYYGCTGTAAIVVEHLEGTLPEIQAPPQLCPEDEGIISVTNAADLASFLWSTGETTSSITGTAPETYYVTVTDNNGCIETGEITIDLFDVADPILTGDADICVDQESVTLEIEQSFAQYQWSTGETTQSIIVTEPAAYEVTVTDVNGCTTTGVHNVIAAPIPAPYIQLPPATCDGMPVLLQVIGLGGPYISYLWSPTGETTSEIVVSEPGTYSVFVTNEFGCTGTSFDEIVEITSPPEAEIDITPVNCNESVILTALGDGDYYWSTGDYATSITVTESGTYGLTVTDDNGCTAVTEVTITISGVLVVDISGPPAVCDGDTVILDVTATYDNYEWSNGAITDQISVSQPGTYSVTVTDQSGCTGTGSITLTSSQAPEPVVIGPDAICNGNTAVLELTSSFPSMIWSNGATTQSITVSEPGTYSVVVTNASGCTATVEWTIDTLPPILVEINGPLSICTGSSATLSVTGNYSVISWNTGETTPQILINGGGVYSVVVTDNSGCTGSDSHEVAIGDSLTPVITVIGSPCADSVMLDAGSGYTTYLWSNNLTTSSITVTSSGAYSVTVSDASGCSGQSTTNVSIGTPPLLSITGPPNVCAGQTATLVASSGFDSYAWSNGSTNDSITVSASGNYSVLVTDTSGCTVTAEMAFEVFPAPIVDILGPASMCTGSSVVLSVSGSFNGIMWSSGETTPSIVVSGSGTYEVLVTDTNGCTGNDVHVMQTADSLSPVIIVSGPLCQGTATLDAGTGYNSYMWSNGATTSSITVISSGTYGVTVSDAGGCSGQSVISVTIPEPPQVSISGPPSVCEGNTGLLSASPGFVSYAWSSGETTESIITSISGQYSVVVTDSNGCTAASSHSFEVLPSPVVDITGPGSICAGDNVSLTLQGNYALVLWNTGQTGNSITASQGGLFSVEVTDANGCTATAEFVLTELQADYTYMQIETCSVQDTGTVQYMMANQYGCDSMIVITTVLVPTLTTNVALSACTGEMAMFNGVQIPAGSSQQFLFTASSGCDSIVTVTVTELPPVEVDLLATATCPGASDGSIEIFVQHGTLPFLFSLNGGKQQSGSFFDDLEGGTYSVLVYDDNGCTYDTMIEVPEAVLAEIEVQDQQIGCGEASIILQPLILAGDADALEWVWSNGSTEPMLEVDRPGNYTVVVNDGCVEQHFNIHVALSGEQEKDKYFFVPNAFSPNEDDVNDLLKVYPAPDLALRSYEFRIFDRWGNLMFSATTTEESWDGIFKGEKMQPGVYVWYIKAEADICHGRVNLLNKGDVTIVR